MPTPAQEICSIAHLVFERKLTDIAGGNISCRAGSQVYMTPTGAGQQHLWRLEPELILQAPVDSDELLLDPRHSKEAISHLLVYRAFPGVQAIIHAHPLHVMPFCAVERQIPAVIKSAQIYAPHFDFIPDVPMYSAEQGECLVAYLRPYEAVMTQRAGVALMPKHGIFIAAPDLRKAADCLERMDTNAYCVLAGRLLGQE